MRLFSDDVWIVEGRDILRTRLRMRLLPPPLLQLARVL
jgi:hypothetical protein